MPAPQCHDSLGFPRRRVAFLGALLLAASLAACGGSRVTTDRAYGELKPKKQLPQRELRDLPENFFVKIENVADAGKSYRNFVVLYVNGREISPVEQVSNFTSTYTYPMRLQHGLYEVKAEYHVVGFWREQVFEIVPDEPVKVLPDHRTVLVARLEKDSRGRPVHDRARFKLSYENLASAAGEVVWESVPSERPIVVQPAPGSRTQAPPVLVPESSLEAARPVPENLTILQINTSPAGADVIIDDRFYGQSPVKIAVTKDQNHVIQISRSGYREVVKVVNAGDLQNETLVQLLIKMESNNAANQQE
jgi:hypothetical protein